MIERIEFYEEEIRKRENLQKMTESKYRESKNQIEKLESNNGDLTQQITQMATIIVW